MHCAQAEYSGERHQDHFPSETVSRRNTRRSSRFRWLGWVEIRCRGQGSLRFGDGSRPAPQGETSGAGQQAEIDSQPDRYRAVVERDLPWHSHGVKENISAYLEGDVVGVAGRFTLSSGKRDQERRPATTPDCLGVFGMRSAVVSTTPVGGLRCQRRPHAPGEGVGRWQDSRCHGFAHRWRRVLRWLGLEFSNVRSAIWMMRALVVHNTLARREDRILYVPIRPTLDPKGERLSSAVSNAHRLANARGLFHPRII